MREEAQSFWGVWWRAIDKVCFLSTVGLILLGIWLIMTASPAVALAHNWMTFVLLKRHLIIVIPSFLILLGTTFLRKSWLLRTSQGIVIGAWLCLWLVLFYGVSIKGARRWLSILGFSLQPSEFLKPALAVVTAGLLSKPWGFFWATVVVGITIIPLFLQPDLGMIFLLLCVWFSQCFVAGLPWIWTLGLMGSGFFSLIGIYLWFPHAAHRIQIFLGTAQQDPFGSQYQINQALKSFSSGGILGKGPGAGSILNNLPDGHADFIFAVAGEEGGLIFCLIILGLYCLIIFRGLWHALNETEIFYRLSILGLTLQMAFQVILNIASVLRLVPTKGVTLPFLSYGGSSFLSLCWAMGMFFSLTRRYRMLT